MRHTEIAHQSPWEGAPAIHLPSVYGASPKKELILRIPVTGERPMQYRAEALPQGLILKNGILRGAVAEEKPLYTLA